MIKRTILPIVVLLVMISFQSCAFFDLIELLSGGGGGGGYTMSKEETEQYEKGIKSEKKHMTKSCIDCDGTGMIINELSISLSKKTWCNICGADRYVGHSHITCPICKGEGTIEGLMWANDSTYTIKRAEKQKKRYHWIAKRLIEDNLKNKTVKDKLLSSELINTFFNSWKLRPKNAISMTENTINTEEQDNHAYNNSGIRTLEAFTSDYTSRQMASDMADIFWDYCHKSVSLEEVEALKEDWVTIKMISIFDEEEVHNLFLKSLEKYMNGEFKGFNQPECTETYLTLFEQLYEKLSLQNVFERERRKAVGLYPQEKMETFFSEQQKLFSITICRRYISEKDMQICIDYLSDTKRQAAYEKISNIAKDNEKVISDRLLDKYLAWIKQKVDLEPYNVLMYHLYADISAFKTSFMEFDK